MELKDEVWKTLKQVNYPGYTRDIVSFGLVQNVAACDGLATVTLGVAHLPASMQQAIVDAVQQQASAIPGVKTLRAVVARPPDTKAAEPPASARESVRQVIAVGSGKGGVGKSTVAANLAVALAAQGLRAGLIDADMYGPNIPRMLGLGPLPPPQNGKLVPVNAQGVEVISAGLMLEPDKPLIWRGPMTDKLVRRFVEGVAWGALDVLVVDLPPGTGDIAMSVAQHLQPEGAVLVVTPQAVASDDARKAAGMFRRLNVPLLGVVENMSYFVCDGCSKQHYLFGRGGGEHLAESLDIPFLGEVPLDPPVREGADRGVPAVTLNGSAAGAALREVAARIWRNALALERVATAQPA